MIAVLVLLILVMILVLHINPSSRVRFTAPSSFYGAKLIQAKVHWYKLTSGSDVTFHFVIRELNSSLVLTSGSFVAPNEFEWITYDLSSLGYIASAHDFYVELIPDSTDTNCILGCNHLPIDWRSQRRVDVYFPDWTDIGSDFFVHVFLDDSFIGVEPSSLGRIRAVYR